MTRPLPPSRATRLAAAALLALALAGCGAATLPQVHSESERLANAKLLMGRREWGLATELLKTYVQNNGGSARVDEALFLLGECEVRSKDWAAAQTDLERLLRDFPESDSAAAGAYMLGEAYWGEARGPDFDQEGSRKALAQWQAYLRSYPDDARAELGRRRVLEARTRLAQKTLATADLYLKMGYTVPARLYYSRLAADYQDVPLVGDALLGLAMCDAREGHRDPAVAALRELETKFPGTPLAARAARERARVEAGRVKITRAPKPIPKPESAAGVGP